MSGSTHRTDASIEPLEPRRLLTADLNFGLSELSGDGAFKAGGAAIVKTYVRNFGDQNVFQQFAIQFKLLDVGFRPNAEKSSFDDPSAAVLATVNIDDDIFIGSVGKQLNIPITFPSGLAPGRYALLAKLDSNDVLLETLESNNTKFIAAGRAFSTDGTLNVTGTTGNDSITVAQTAAGYSVNVNGYIENFTPTDVTSFYVTGDAGDDVLIATGVIPSLRMDGQDGDDALIGSDGNDTLIGGAHKDVLYGGLGNDRLNGNGGNDKLLGEAGSDRLYGYAGNDYLDGASSSDRLEGGAGRDTMFGQGGNDRFFARDGEIDELYGASGTDQGQSDVADILSSINIGVA